MKDEDYVTGELINIIAHVVEEEGKYPKMEVGQYIVLADFDMDVMKKETGLGGGELRSYLIDNNFIEKRIFRTSALFI